MKTLTLGIFLLIAGPVFSQVSDNFDDSDLLLNPIWEGPLFEFKTINGELNSISNKANASFYLSTPSANTSFSEWRIDIRLLFNTSSLNYVDFVVMSDSSNLLKMMNGYFVRLGGITDEISLYKLKGGVETKIIDGMDNVLNGSYHYWQICLDRKDSGIFRLGRKSLGGTGYLISEGVACDSDIVSSLYCGIRVRQSTSSFFGKHFFDNYYAGKIIKDTLIPVLDSVILADDRKLMCYFNEACDSISFKEDTNYQLSYNNQYPDSIQIVSNKQVLLYFHETFPPNLTLSINIKDIRDLAGNKMLPVSRSFFNSKPDYARIGDLLITEFLPDPLPVVGMKDHEYVEIKNISDKFIQLNGCRIHDPASSKYLPAIVLAPDSNVVLTNIPSLNNAGDKIWITNQQDEILHLVNYTDEWYKDETKKNGGWSLEMVNVSNVCKGQGNWLASIHPIGGTPGRNNSVTGILSPDIRAPKAVSVSPLNDSIIHIEFDEEIDSINSLNAILLVNGKNGTLKLTEMTGNFTGGDWLIDFKPDPDSTYRISIEGMKDCSGNYLLQQTFSLQWPDISRRNDLIFNEILFNPKIGGYDYIEIYNTTSRTFDLSRHFIAVLDESGQYKSIEKISTTSLFIQPYQYLLISADNATVCRQYTCSNPGFLSIDFSKMPSMPDDAGNLMLINLGGKVIDSLSYSASWHFPLISDKEGVSLERISSTSASRTVDNWHSAASIAGFGTPGDYNSQSTFVHQPTNYFTLENRTISPDEDGFEDVLILNYQLPDPNFTTSIHIYDTEGRLVKKWLNNETLGSDGFITWNGTDFNSNKAGIGMYILDIECSNTDGSYLKERLSFTVAGKF